MCSGAGSKNKGINVKGVNQDLGDRCSAIAAQWAATTAAGRPALRPGISCGGFANFVCIGDLRIAVSSDGIGTKIEIAERMTKYGTLGFDLVAMAVDDLAVAGIEPLAIANILDVNLPDPQTIDELMEGLAEACKACGVIMAGGEIAQLGQRIRGYGPGMHFNWAATAIGFVDPSQKEFDDSVIPGDSVIALASDGFRSNGFTLARRILEARFGDSWHQVASEAGATWGELLLVPSRLYAPALSAGFREGLPIRSAAHITGGAIPGNLPRGLENSHCGARLDQLWEPHESMLEIICLGNVAMRDAYEQWNMGNGLLLVVPEEAAQAWVTRLLENGQRAKVAGTIIDSPIIEIHNPSSPEEKAQTWEIE